MPVTNATATPNLVTLSVDVTAAYVAHHHARAADVPALLTAVHATLAELAAPARADAAANAEADQPAHAPAVSARKSLASREHIVSMIDGRPYKSLRRHLSANRLTPDQYRERYGLRADYPMVAPAYSEARSAMARALGLGRKAVARVAEVAVEPVQEVAVGAGKPKRAPRGVAAAKAAAKKHLGG